jgi:azurin
MKMPKLTLIGLFVTSVMISGCGGGGQSQQNSNKDQEEKQRPDMGSGQGDKAESSDEKTASSSESEVADLTGDGDKASVTIKTPGTTMQNMEYDINNVKVKKGQTVEVTLKNTAPESAKAMQHNFVVVKPENARDVATAGMKNKDNGYLPEDQSNILASTKILKPGEKTTVTFSIDKTGTYEFICTYPGHYPTMKGEIEVVA